MYASVCVGSALSYSTNNEFMIHSLKQVKFITIPELDIKELLLKLVDECPFVTYSKWFECNCLLGYFQTIYIRLKFSLKRTLLTDKI